MTTFYFRSTRFIYIILLFVHATNSIEVLLPLWYTSCPYAAPTQQSHYQLHKIIYLLRCFVYVCVHTLSNMKPPSTFRHRFHFSFIYHRLRVTKRCAQVTAELNAIRVVCRQFKFVCLFFSIN